jgi:hypothetical protein
VVLQEPGLLISIPYNTPCPPSILTNGVRKVPANLREHPEDLCDALQIKFNQAVIQNPEKKHKNWITWKERGHLIRHLTMTEEAWKALPLAEKNTLKRNWCHKLSTLGRKGLFSYPLRQATLDDDVYYIIKQTHERLGHAG